MKEEYLRLITLPKGQIVADGIPIYEDRMISFDGVYYFYEEVKDKYKIIPFERTPDWKQTFFDPRGYEYIEGKDYRKKVRVMSDEIGLSLKTELERFADVSVVEDIGESLEITVAFRNADTMARIMSAMFRRSSGLNGMVTVVQTSDKGCCYEAENCVNPRRHYVFTFRFANADAVVSATQYLEKLRCTGFETKTNDLLTYFNNEGRRTFQWELWPMCNNICKFCYLGKENRATHKERQMKSLQDCLKAVENLDTELYNNVSLIGGEFFQGQLDDPEVHDLFMKLMERCAKYYQDSKIGSIWITATLTLGDQKHLYEALDIFRKYGVEPKPEFGASGVWICTSWDADGRFHTPEHRKNWEFHMKNIHEKYPEIKFNTTIILMQALVDQYLSGEWSPKRFMDEFHTFLFYKQCGLGEINFKDFEIEGGDNSDIALNERAKIWTNEQFGFPFYPTRQSMLRFFQKYATDDPDTYDRLFNIAYRADELHRNHNNLTTDLTHVRFKNASTESNTIEAQRINKCGHILNYTAYINSDKCCICDRNRIWNTIHGGE